MNFMPNKLLFVVTVLLGAYWSLGWYVPGLWLSTTLAIFSVLVGLAIVVKYFRGVYRVLIKGARSEDEDGAHLAALGIPAIASSVVYGGMFTLAWNLAGQPPDWLGTPASNFSRLLLVLGCVAFYFTPDIQRQQLKLSSVVWLVVIMTTAVLSAFILGLYVSNDRLIDVNRIRPITYPACPEDRPYWVASSSGYFHFAETSPWAPKIIPRRCFTSPEEAVAAGYVAAPS